jgi:hypothetical protein
MIKQERDQKRDQNRSYSLRILLIMIISLRCSFAKTGNIDAEMFKKKLRN